MKDLDYLRRREAVSRTNAARAANEPARRVHAELAKSYADRIAAAEDQPKFG